MAEPVLFGCRPGSVVNAMRCQTKRYDGLSCPDSIAWQTGRHLGQIPIGFMAESDNEENLCKSIDFLVIRRINAPEKEH